MANIDNECKDLEVVDFYANSTTHLHDILQNQKDMQEKVYGYDYSKMSLNELMQFWHMNNHALLDEVHEATDALGGIKDGDGSAVWKKWKKAHDSYKEKTISDLSPGDLKELHMEIVDILHFFMNMAVSTGLDAKTMYNYYFAKAEENKQRQKNNY
jgi:hypothetical protein